MVTKAEDLVRDLSDTQGISYSAIARAANKLKRDSDIEAIKDGPKFEKGDFLTNFFSLQEWCYRIARMKGFHDKSRDPGMAMALIHSEVTEALEALRKGPDKDSEHIPEFTALEEELADIIIRVLDFAEEYDSPTPGSGQNGLRIGEAIFAKVAYNAKREKMHGGRLSNGLPYRPRF